MKITMILLVVALLLLVIGLGMGQHTIDRTTVTAFDLDRFLGRWYEIARFNHRFERGLGEVEALYELQPDGMIRVINSGTDSLTHEHRVKSGRAKTTSQSGRLRVSFFWIFYSDYNVLAIDNDYKWALIGGRSPRYLWILSRTPTLPESTLEMILTEARRRGYDTNRLHFVLQPKPLK